MPKGNLVVQLSDMAGAPVKGPVEVDLRRVEGSPGAGGQNMEVSVKGPIGTLTVTGIPCQTGPGTMYEVRVSAPHHRKYAFFQLIREDRDNPASDDVEFWVKPGEVSGIRPPGFADLLPIVRGMFDQASMIVAKAEDKEMVGLSGGPLYQQMGALRQACLLNIAKKAGDPRTAGNCLPHIRGLLISRQDRLFARVDPALVQVVQQGAMFKSAPGKLHTPPPGFAMSPVGSFKSKDPHANLQVTFMTEDATGDLAADIDIDEASGIEHGFEVIRNALFKNRTNPYLIREFLNAADFTGRSLSPDYGFTF
jgi:hypothetical protein